MKPERKGKRKREINPSSPGFKEYISLLKEKEPRKRAKRFYQLGLRRLKAVYKMALACRSAHPQPKFTARERQKLINQIEKFILQMKRRQK